MSCLTSHVTGSFSNGVSGIGVFTDYSVNDMGGSSGLQTHKKTIAYNVTYDAPDIQCPSFFDDLYDFEVTDHTGRMSKNIRVVRLTFEGFVYIQKTAITDLDDVKDIGLRIRVIQDWANNNSEEVFPSVPSGYLGCPYFPIGYTGTESSYHKSPVPSPRFYTIKDDIYRISSQTFTQYCPVTSKFVTQISLPYTFDAQTDFVVSYSDSDNGKREHILSGNTVLWATSSMKTADSY